MTCEDCDTDPIEEKTPLLATLDRMVTLLWSLLVALVLLAFIAAATGLGLLWMAQLTGVAGRNLCTFGC